MAKLNLRKLTNTNNISEKNSKSSIVEAFMSPIPFKIGKTYIFRTVNMCNIGKVINIVGNFIELDDDAVWVAESGKWEDFLSKGKTTTTRIDKFNTIVGINANMIVDYAEWKWNIPT
jgi:hypothetical protein